MVKVTDLGDPWLPVFGRGGPEAPPPQPWQPGIITATKKETHTHIHTIKDQPRGEWASALQRLGTEAPPEAAPATATRAAAPVATPHTEWTSVLT